LIGRIEAFKLFGREPSKPSFPMAIPIDGQPFKAESSVGAMDLQSTLRYAVENAKFYKALGISGENLSEFPIVNRTLVRDRFRDLLTVSGRTGDAILGIIEGSDIPAEATKKTEFGFGSTYVIEQTSGTSGIPLRLVKSTKERTKLSLETWKRRVAIDSALTVGKFFPIFHRVLDEPMACDPFATTSDGIARFYNWISEKQIRWLHAPVRLLAFQALALRQRSLRFPESLKFIELSGSSVSADDVALLESLGAQVVNQYGTRESWAIGYALGSDAFDLVKESVHVELLDENNRRIEIENKEGNVVITSCILRALPIIRYMTGDRGVWDSCRNGLSNRKKIMRLALTGDRELNMLTIGGKRVSGNTFFKDLLYKIDQRIGFGYAEFIHIRRKGLHKWELIIQNCSKTELLFRELLEVLRIYDHCVILELKMLSSGNAVASDYAKPYLFVNEFECIKNHL
jgi:phenylacetate-CoA ligase